MMMENRKLLPGNNIPYIPLEIDLNDLHENLGLLTEEKIAEVERCIDNDSDRRITKHALQEKFKIVLPYSILVHNNEKYAVYKGRKRNKGAGVGSFGAVKYLQNLKTKQWFALKTMSQRHINCSDIERKFAPEDMQAVSTHEHAMLTHFDLALGRLETRTSKKKGLQYYIVMRAMEGEDLFDFIEKRIHNLHPQHFMELLINVCRAALQFHQSGFIHRDIRQENMRFYPSTGVVKLLDFGLVEKPAADGKYHDQNLFGTKDKRAPEILSGLYSPSTDAFSTGATVADLLHILDNWVGEYASGELLPRTMIVDGRRSSLMDKTTLLAIYDLCEKMMRPVESERMGLQEAIDGLMLIQQSMQCGHLTISVLDMNEYLRLSTADKAEMISGFTRYCHELVLKSSPNLTINTELQKLVRALSVAGVKVHNKIFYENDDQLILKELEQATPRVKRVPYVLHSQSPRRMEEVPVVAMAPASQLFKPVAEQHKSSNLKEEIRKEKRCAIL